MQKILVDKIMLSGKEVNVYLCDRKAKCKNSILCGNECTRTFDEKHALKIGGDTMLLKTIADYQNEIERVQTAIDNTESDHLKRDYKKYLNRLKREMKKKVYAND